MADSNTVHPAADWAERHPPPEGRRKFLIATAGLLGAGAVGLLADVLVNNMNPGKAVAAEGAPIDVDVSKLAPGQIITVEWKKKPVWVLHRDKKMLETLSQNGLLARLKDPQSKSPQQPAAHYINGNYRALKPEFLVAVALCTHMQCVPNYRPSPHTVTSWWYGGFHCPCHGSNYDLSARVFEGSPAPLNIPIPPYFWKETSVVRIGEGNAKGLHQNWTPSIW